MLTSFVRRRKSPAQARSIHCGYDGARRTAYWVDEIARTMSLIYCLYPTDNGRHRYIGQTTKAIEARLAQHVAEARRGSATGVGTWVRARLEASFQIRAHILQVAVAPGDVSLFER
jgi:hypothetical protein